MIAIAPRKEGVHVICRPIAAPHLAVALFPSAAVASTHHPKASAASAQVAQFDTEAAAQRHCPSDQVPWLNRNSGIYYEKDTRWYGRTKYGAFGCREEADAAGDRDMWNG